MANVSAKREMLEFIADNLSKKYKQTKSSFGPFFILDISLRKQLALENLVNDEDSNLNSVDSAKLILIAEHTPNFENGPAIKLDNLKHSSQIPFIYILLKDGTTFFRSNAKKLHYKSTYEKSLKRYDTIDINKIIIFSPEEIFAFNRNNPHARLLPNPQSVLQYYQPQSERLVRGLVSYLFEPILFDYTHRPELMMSRFVDPSEHSKIRYQWTRAVRYDGKLQINPKSKKLIDETKSVL